MQRRQFLSRSLAGIAGASIPGATPAATTDSIVTPKLNTGEPIPYFGEPELNKAIGAEEPGSTKRPFVVAYNFPSWHSTPVMEKWFGKGWTEFQTLRDSHPLFVGHQMPRQPLWGFFNEADPAWAEREIDAASTHGIDAWMIDWYWHNGIQLYHEQLERGFLKSSNRSKLKFAVMWANHHWKNVYPASSPDNAAVLLPQEHSLEDCDRVADYCVRNYFADESYWRLGNGPVFGIFDLNMFVKSLTMDGAKRAIENMRNRVRKAGLGDLHVQASHVYDGLIPKFKDLGIGSATQYHTYGLSYSAATAGKLLPFSDAAANTIGSWRELEKQMTVPFFPDCPVGWDDSPRFGTYSGVVIGRSPDQYERLLRAARIFVTKQDQAIVYLSAWNEWTEDHVLLPDLAHGYGYLEAVRRAFRMKQYP
jgi:hypothetical protein